MDVVKIRLQQQHHPFPKGQCFYYYNGLMEHVCTPCENNRPCAWYQRPGNFSGTVLLIRSGRLRHSFSMERVVSHAVLMAVPATVFYYSLYDTLLLKISKLRLCCRRTLSPQRYCPPDWSAAMLAGTVARAVAVTIVSPLEMIRTKMQSEQLNYKDIGRALRVTTLTHGIPGFYLGLLPTLLRDIPFSAIYWAFYDTLKNRLMTWKNMKETSFSLSFASGAMAGSFAAVITTPFDVIKTHLQIKLGDGSAAVRVPIAATVREIINKVRLRIFNFSVNYKYWSFSGVVPRVAKVAPACAVMIGSYEYFKVYFERVNASRRNNVPHPHV
ncbi:unnamed protein product [Nippostrongylus brasiliensis]|uniref:Uncharacterized mitochondrial carrier (inferred by orthology to a C. elegans protein) n=1 Tax=Nippostrongylus brasiliensis TaxID=27835 RepID=A0A0N4XDZ3_NIPBR|nr:unnamed protein product [Nippostrongylus brasiliensis]